MNFFQSFGNIGSSILSSIGNFFTTPVGQPNNLTTSAGNMNLIPASFAPNSSTPFGPAQQTPQGPIINLPNKAGGLNVSNLPTNASTAVKTPTGQMAITPQVPGSKVGPQFSQGGKTTGPSTAGMFPNMRSVSPTSSSSFSSPAINSISSPAINSNGFTSGVQGASGMPSQFNSGTGNAGFSSGNSGTIGGGFVRGGSSTAGAVGTITPPTNTYETDEQKRQRLMKSAGYDQYGNLIPPPAGSPYNQQGSQGFTNTNQPSVATMPGNPNYDQYGNLIGTPEAASPFVRPGTGNINLSLPQSSTENNVPAFSPSNLSTNEYNPAKIAQNLSDINDALRGGRLTPDDISKVQGYLTTVRGQSEEYLRQLNPTPKDQGQPPSVDDSAQAQYLANLPPAERAIYQSRIDEFKNMMKYEYTDSNGNQFNGMPALEANKIDVLRQLNAAELAASKIYHDTINDPELPTSLAQKRIKAFNDQNDLYIKGLQGHLTILNESLQAANTSVNSMLGISQFEQNIDIRKQDLARQEVQQLISSGALANASDMQVQQYAQKYGGDVNALTSMRDVLKQQPLQTSYQTNGQGEITAISLMRDGSYKTTPLGNFGKPFNPYNVFAQAQSGALNPLLSGLSEGLIAPIDVNSRNAAIFNQLFKQNPTFNAIQANAAAKFWESTAAQEKMAWANTTEKDFSTLRTLSGQIKRSAWPLVNQAILAGKINVQGDPVATSFVQAASRVASSLSRVLGDSGGSDFRTRLASGVLDPAFSQATFDRVLSTESQLINNMVAGFKTVGGQGGTTSGNASASFDSASARSKYNY